MATGDKKTFMKAQLCMNIFKKYMKLKTLKFINKKYPYTLLILKIGVDLKIVNRYSVEVKPKELKVSTSGEDGLN